MTTPMHHQFHSSHNKIRGAELRMYISIEALYFETCPTKFMTLPRYTDDENMPRYKKLLLYVSWIWMDLDNGKKLYYCQSEVSQI